MNHSIIRENFIKVMLAIVSVFLVILSPNSKKIWIIFKVIVISINCVPVIFNSFYYKKYIYLIFTGLTYELLCVMTLLIYLIDMPETSWRTMYSNLELCNVGMMYICFSLLATCIVYYGSNFRKTSHRAKLFLKSYKFKINRNFYALYCMLSLVFLVIFILKSGFFTQRDYMSGGNSTLISVFRILQAVHITFFFIGESKEGKIMKLLKNMVLIIFIILDVIMGLFGYRFILVELCFFLIFMNMDKIKKLKLKNVIILFGVVFCLYIMFSLIRNNSLNNENPLESFFKHERNIFYSLIAILENRPDKGVNTYINSFQNLLPGLANGVNENTGRILIQYIQPSAYNTSNVTMGGFFLTEAFYNYGVMGIFVMSFIFPLLFSFLEKKSDRKVLNVLIYYFFAAQMYSVIYYGSSNFIKIILYYSLFIKIYIEFGKIGME